MSMVPINMNQRWKMILPEHRTRQWENLWEAPRLESMCRNIAQGDVIFDVGAETFDMSGLYASWGAKVALFEPVCAMWPNAKAIWEANDLRAPISCFVGFAGAETDLTAGDLVLDGEWPECAEGEPLGEVGFAQLNERPDIARIRLDDAITRLPLPDVITLDVEGSEMRVMVGAMKILQLKRPLVWCSVHPTFMADQYNDSADDLHRLMESLGYKRTLLEDSHEMHFLYWHEYGRYVTL